MSRGIGPVLLTHFTPDEAEADIVEEPAPAATDKARAGVLIAPAPTGHSARHRAGRGKRSLVLAKPARRTVTDTAVSTTTELPLRHHLRNIPRNIRILAMTAAAVVLIAIGFGMVRPATQLAGTPIPGGGPSHVNGMQPGTLPDAALSGVPTTTVAPPPPSTQASPPPTTHHTTHAAPPPVVTTQKLPIGNGFPNPGQPCSQPGAFTFDSHYHPMECATDNAGNLTWQEF